MEIINNNEKNEGKKLSFFQLFTLENLSIEIPIIQRDYAQGREAALNIRNQFVNALFNSLISNTPLHLDFVYGNVIDKKFTPLDGQQRLTTLFLLHWYLSIKENSFEHFQRFIRKGDISKFTYETRLSSREFCHELVNHKIEKLEENETYSSTIKNKNWYFSTWEKDPTIKSMLVMLDTIDEIYKSHIEIPKLYKLLISEEDPTITFQFIELKDFGLSDSLYIKMNARGKPLTNFENFKAKFEQLLIDYDIENNKSFGDIFKEKIDTNWSDLFWEFRGKNSQLFDQEFMNFVRVVLTGTLASSSENKTKVLSYMTKSDGNLGYYELEKYGVITYQGIDDIISFLNLIEENGSFHSYLKDAEAINEEQLFLDVTNYDITYIKRIQFYALYKYIIYNAGSQGIDEWMRIIRNLTSNSVFRQSETYEIAIKSVDQMLPFSKNILDYFKDSNKPKGFLGFQIEEEKMKSFLIQKSDEWANTIKDIENHGYFNGQIEFLLDFCGITSYFNENQDMNWTTDLNTKFLNDFILFKNKAVSIFDNKGLKMFPDYLFERALLTFGNYTLTKGRNRSFLVNQDREIGWKRLLRDSENGKRHLFKELLNKLNSTENIEEQLRLIISKSQTSNWTRYFIKYSQIIDKCGNEKMFRIGPEYGYQDILLLEKKQTNGKHREYFTFGLLCQLLEMGHHVDYQTASSVDDWKHISSIDNKPIYIRYWELEKEDDFGFIVENGDDVFESKYEEGVIDYLKSSDII
ncbi:DUF262 domain-containing protein [uncultured Maribacter sp.]|uniref:DUF262 domain-containing protein n=1 Tax=uncultured Maribacter sp. TaxID=431308 RepID=UPI002635A56E|nr:DUF262 domain-containing protein [uncultured Maribacter sp.]